MASDKEARAVNIGRLSHSDFRLYRGAMKSTGAKRDVMLFARVTLDERNALQEALKPHGWPVAQFIRAIMLDVIDAHRGVPPQSMRDTARQRQMALPMSTESSPRGERIKPPARAARRGQAKGSTKGKRKPRPRPKKLSRAKRRGRK